jgi:NAD(P)-dependent dehydrogenase (short-subunit alcohol dehydrogenase family)
MIGAFDPMLRKSADGRLLAVTSSVGSNPRAYWGAYGASKAALETLVLSYADEVRGFGSPKVAIVDPGATATLMRAQAFPGEDQSTIKQPADVADAVMALLERDFETGHRLVVER